MEKKQYMRAGLVGSEAGSTTAGYPRLSGQEKSTLFRAGSGVLKLQVAVCVVSGELSPLGGSCAQPPRAATSAPQGSCIAVHLPQEALMLVSGEILTT